MSMRLYGWVALAGLLLLGGCGKSTLFSSTKYRIVKTPGMPLVLPPLRDVKQSGKQYIFIIKRDAELPGPSVSGRDCTLKQPPFELAADGNRWKLTMPAVDSWPPPESRREDRSTGDVFDDLSALVAHACVTQQQIPQLQRAIRESLPSTPADSARYLMGVRLDEGSIDLQPGMRLKMESALFRNNSTALADYTGTRLSIVNLVPGPGSNPAFQAEQSPDAATATEEQEVLLKAPPLRHFRLFLLTLYVRSDVKRAALIAGSDDFQKLAQVIGQVRERPSAPCEYLASLQPSMFCKAYSPSTSVSVEVSVSLNGQTRYIPAGSSVRSIFAPLKPPALEAFLSQLRIYRKYRGAYFPVDFSADPAAVMDLSLVNTDRVEWRTETASLKPL